MTARKNQGGGDYLEKPCPLCGTRVDRFGSRWGGYAPLLFHLTDKHGLNMEMPIWRDAGYGRWECVCGEEFPTAGQLSKHLHTATQQHWVEVAMRRTG